MMHKWFVITILAIICVGCNSVEYVEVTNTDTVHHYTRQRDSIMMWDSVYVDRYVNGDTIKITKESYKLRYKDKLVTDTLYITKEIQVPMPIEKKLTKWQQFKIDAGEFMLGGIIVALAVIAVLWIIWARKR